MTSMFVWVLFLSSVFHAVTCFESIKCDLDSSYPLQLQLFRDEKLASLQLPLTRDQLRQCIDDTNETDVKNALRLIYTQGCCCWNVSVPLFYYNNGQGHGSRNTGCLVGTEPIIPTALRKRRQVQVNTNTIIAYAPRIQKTGSKSYERFLRDAFDTPNKKPCNVGFPISTDPRMATLSSEMASPCCQIRGQNKNTACCSVNVVAKHTSTCSRVLSSHHCNFHAIKSAVVETDLKNAIFVTRLRDPIDRVISEFKHLSVDTNTLRTANHTFPRKQVWDYCVNPSSVVNLGDATYSSYIAFLTDPIHNSGTWNRMTRMLAENQNWPPTLPDLQSAKDSIVHDLDVVEFFERGDNFFNATRQAFGVPGFTTTTKPVLQKADTTKLPYFFQTHQNQIAFETAFYNQLDLELYYFARAVYVNSPPP